MSAVLDFETPKLAEAIEAMTAQQLDDLPFGVIGLDPNGVVRLYNRTESERSGYKKRPAMGKTFFTDVAPCMNNGYFKGRIDKALKAGKLDIRFSFVGDFSDRERELTVRVQSAADGGIWVFMLRPAQAEA